MPGSKVWSAEEMRLASFYQQTLEDLERPRIKLGLMEIHHFSSSILWSLVKYWTNTYFISIGGFQNFPTGWAWGTSERQRLRARLKERSRRCSDQRSIILLWLNTKSCSDWILNRGMSASEMHTNELDADHQFMTLTSKDNKPWPQNKRVKILVNSNSYWENLIETYIFDGDQAFVVGFFWVLFVGLFLFIAVMVWRCLRLWKRTLGPGLGC